MNPPHASIKHQIARAAARLVVSLRRGSRPERCGAAMACCGCGCSVCVPNTKSPNHLPNASCLALSPTATLHLLTPSGSLTIVFPPLCVISVARHGVGEAEPLVGRLRWVGVSGRAHRWRVGVASGKAGGEKPSVCSVPRCGLMCGHGGAVGGLHVPQPRLLFERGARLHRPAAALTTSSSWDTTPGMAYTARRGWGF